MSADKLDEIAERLWEYPTLNGIRAALEEARQEDRAAFSEPFRVFCEKHSEHKPVYTEGRPLLDDTCARCKNEEDRAEIERLRAEVISWTASAGEQRSRAEAAEKEIERLRAELDEHGSAKQWYAEAEKQMKRAEAAEASVERLTEMFKTALARANVAEAKVAEVTAAITGPGGWDEVCRGLKAKLAEAQAERRRAEHLWQLAQTELAEAQAYAKRGWSEAAATGAEARKQLDALRAVLAAERAKTAEAQAIVAKVNNEVFGSDGYFTRPDCVEAVAALKFDCNQQRAKTAKLVEALETLEAHASGVVQMLVADMTDHPEQGLARFNSAVFVRGIEQAREALKKAK